MEDHCISVETHILRGEKGNLKLTSRISATGHQKCNTNTITQLEKRWFYQTKLAKSTVMEPDNQGCLFITQVQDLIQDSTHRGLVCLHDELECLIYGIFNVLTVPKS